MGLQKRQLPYVPADSYVSPAPVQLSDGTDEKDKTSHVGKVMTEVAIKQLAACVIASPSIRRCSRGRRLRRLLWLSASLSVECTPFFFLRATSRASQHTECFPAFTVAAEWKPEARGTLRKQGFDRRTVTRTSSGHADSIQRCHRRLTPDATSRPQCFQQNTDARCLRAHTPGAHSVN